jgi:2-phosphosulfolactate phosphatase
MPQSLEVLFTPAEIAALPARDMSGTVCVVFDVLRATSSMVAALANGATAIKPVAEIAEALALRNHDPDLLLAGERDGIRIPAALTGGIEFDLGNSPREFTQAAVGGRRIAITTTNGTRALRACAQARGVYLGSFLNLRATAERLTQQRPHNLLLVCSGTFEQCAYEDVLGAGALCDRVWSWIIAGNVADSAVLARRLYLLEQGKLAEAVSGSRNGRRLLARPELAADVDFCVQRELFRLTAQMDKDGWVRAGGPP